MVTASSLQKQQFLQCLPASDRFCITTYQTILIWSIPVSYKYYGSSSKWFIEQEMANKHNLITCATFTGYIFQYGGYLME